MTESKKKIQKTLKCTIETWKAALDIQRPYEDRGEKAPTQEEIVARWLSAYQNQNGGSAPAQKQQNLVPTVDIEALASLINLLQTFSLRAAEEAKTLKKAVASIEGIIDGNDFQHAGTSTGSGNLEEGLYPEMVDTYRGAKEDIAPPTAGAGTGSGPNPRVPRKGPVRKTKAR